MNGPHEPKIDIIQWTFRSADLAPITTDIQNLVESIKQNAELTCTEDANDLHITPRRESLGGNKNLPEEFGQTLLAIKLNKQHCYIEIVSNATITVLEKLLPPIKAAKAISNIISKEMERKRINLAKEKAKFEEYVQRSTKERARLAERSKDIPESAPAEVLEELVCVPEHGLAISSFATKRVALGTVGLHACIGLALVNPAKKLAGVTHLDKPTIETYRSSLGAMCNEIVSDKKECRLYLIGGAQEPKEDLRKARPEAYQGCLVSETLACSIKDFLWQYDKNIADARIDMFNKERPDGFALQLAPDRVKLFRIRDDDAAQFDELTGSDAEGDGSEHSGSEPADENSGDRMKVYHKNMITDAIYYQELQEYSGDPEFLAKRVPPAVPTSLPPGREKK
jgi:hypothetical protein